MELRPFGPTARPVAVVGQGTWNMEGDDRAAAIAALRRGIERGMTHIDTAEMYGGGAVEELVAEAIAGRRDEIFLVSKVLPTNASRAGTIAACERSLSRLRTDRLDCYLLHWPSRHRLEDTIAGFEQLEREGKIRAYGVSNFDLADLEAAVAIAGERRLACNQVLYHLHERAIEEAVIPWCEQQEVAIVAYSPFGSGRFPAARSPAGRVLQEIADAHHATPRQIALAFLVRTPSTFAIPKAARPEHAAENAAAAALQLTRAELARIEKAFPRGRRRALPTL